MDLIVKIGKTGNLTERHVLIWFDVANYRDRAAGMQYESLVERMGEPRARWMAARGAAGAWTVEGRTRADGDMPINCSGGLLAKGHPVGATGVGQLYEAVQQLRGQAGATQVPDARIGMAQNIGGSGASIVAHVLKAED